MKKYQIIVDSCCDLTKEMVEKFDIKVIPLHISADGVNFYTDNEELSPEEFVDLIMKNPDFKPKTATPTPEAYITAFEQAISENKDILCFASTQSLTSCIRTAEIAKNHVLENHPDAVIEVLDTKTITACEAILVMHAAKLRDKGIDMLDLIKGLTKDLSLSRIFFIISSTKYLHLGGRIGKVGAIATDFLSIKPLIVLKNGEISAFGITRSRKAGLSKIIKAVKDFFSQEGLLPENFTICVATSHDVKEALQGFIKLVEQEIGAKVSKMEYVIGSTILAHTGPGVLGLCLVKNPEI